MFGVERGLRAYPVVPDQLAEHLKEMVEPHQRHIITTRVLAWWREALRLNEWRVNLVWNDARAWDYFGTVHRAAGRPEASITLWAFLPDLDTIERTCIHELTHLVLMNMTILAEQWRESIPEESRSIYDAQWTEAVEKTVDHVTMMLDEMMGGLATAEAMDYSS